MSDNDKTDLREILQAVGEAGKLSFWEISDVECLGESAEVLYQIADEAERISGEDFYNIVSGVYQVIEGDFAAYHPNQKDCWLLIKSIDGTEFDIETKDKELLESIRASFKNVKDLVY